MGSARVRNPWLVDSAIVERGVSASMGHRRVGGESNDDIGRLRRRASATGISVRTERANRTSEQRAYSLVDRTSGNVLHGGIATLIDLEAVLSRIAWDRRRAPADGPPRAEAPRSCPSCGTSRVGQFRFCRTCGHDFEAMAHVAEHWPPFQLEPATVPDATPPVEALSIPPQILSPAPVARAGLDPRHRR